MYQLIVFEIISLRACFWWRWVNRTWSGDSDSTCFTISLIFYAIFHTPFLMFSDDLFHFLFRLSRGQSCKVLDKAFADFKAKPNSSSRWSRDFRL